jgi:hypothetical protein
MQQKDQIELDLGTGQAVKPQAPPPEDLKRARRQPKSKAGRSRDRRWKRWSSV